MKRISNHGLSSNPGDQNVNPPAFTGLIKTVVYPHRCHSPNTHVFSSVIVTPSQVWNTSHYYNVAFDLTGSIVALRYLNFNSFNLEVICRRQVQNSLIFFFKIRIHLNVECRKYDDKCIRKSTNMHALYVSIILKLDWEQREGNKIHLNRESKLNNVATQQRMCKSLLYCWQKGFVHLFI